MVEIVHQGEVSTLAHQHLFQSVQLIHHLHQHPLVVFHALNLHLKLQHLLFHCCQKGPYLGTQVPIGTFLTFWVPIYLSG